MFKKKKKNTEDTILTFAQCNLAVYIFSYTISLCFKQVGVGMCMEGIEQNPVVYELMSEMAFRSEKVNLEVIGFVESFNLSLQGKHTLLAPLSLKTRHDYIQNFHSKMDV